MNVGILWDIENVTPPSNTNYIQSVIEKVSEDGRISYAIAFGNWNDNSIRNIAYELSVNNFELIHIPKSRKNSSDMSLVAHGVELIFQYPHIERFVLISGDGDFRPLLVSQRKYGKETWVICDVKNNASEDLLRMADKYFDYRDIINLNDNQEIGLISFNAEHIPDISKEQAFELFKEAVTIITNENKFPSSGGVKTKMKLLNNQFDESSFGYNTWYEFVSEAKIHTDITFENGHFALKENDDNTIPEVFKKLIESIPEKNKWVLIAKIGDKFDYKKYGYSKLLNLALDAEKRGYIETNYDATNTTWSIMRKC
jgi:uncharacterized LabA/DUF88 family protein